MADKRKTVETTTTTKQTSSNGDTTVTTTVTTKKTTTKSEKKKISLKQILIIAGILLLMGIAAMFIIFGRAHVTGNSMDGIVDDKQTVFFNRLASIDEGDVILFRHPEDDSIVPSAPDKNYYRMCRLYGPNWCNKSEVVSQKKKKRSIYASRVYGLPGEVISIQGGYPCKNDNQIKNLCPSAKYPHVVVTKSLLKFHDLDSIGIKKESMNCRDIDSENIIGYYRHTVPQYSNVQVYNLTEQEVSDLESLPQVISVNRVSLPKEHFDPTVFPYDEQRHYNFTEMGKMVVPAKGKVMKLNVNNLCLYRRCIEAYENNKVEVDNGKIFINGKETNSYRFTRDYYFVLGDNGENINDSRYFGFLPENYVVGVVN